MKLYGSVDNRFDEGRYYNGTLNNIKVGDYVTEYLWSDRHAYEVVEVKDQKHISIRRLKAVRADKNGMSDAQSYKYESDVKEPKINLVQRNNNWYIEKEHSKEIIEQRAKKDFENGHFKSYEVAYNYFRAMQGLTMEQLKRFDEGKVIKTYKKISISFGIADEYFDYSF